MPDDKIVIKTKNRRLEQRGQLALGLDAAARLGRGSTLAVPARIDAGGCLVGLVEERVRVRRALGHARAAMAKTGTAPRRITAAIATLGAAIPFTTDRKSTRLNSSHLVISYAVFCLKKKNTDR